MNPIRFYPDSLRMQFFRAAALMCLCSLAPAGFALDTSALPSGGQVAAGAAVISKPSAQSLRVDQSSQNAVLNWQSFSIGTGNSVVFLQPSASSVVLNRVIGIDASRIFGSLSANGQLFLVNPNGVLFGRTAQVEVGGIAASALGIRDSDFMSGRYVFTKEGSAGTVVNEGTITTLSGYAALIGPQVSNTGLINARMGTAALAAGDKVTLDMVGDGLINIRVNQAALNASAVNKGTIIADGGNVLMTARSANALLETVLNNEGIIRANALAERGGVIYLDGGTAGVTSISGTLEASGLGAGQKGGSITVLGDKVGLFGKAAVTASGDAGGGTVLIGGNFQGKGPEKNATMTYVGPDAAIRANAVTSGDGGRVIVWADDSTSFAGTLEARGGSVSGNGGFAEVSGKHSLDFSPKAVDMKSAGGSVGTLLLDPENIVVAAGGGADYADVNAFSARAGSTQTISPATLENTNATINLQANNDITITDKIFLKALNAAFSAKAGNNINVNAGITTRDGTISLSARDPGGNQTVGGTVNMGPNGYLNASDGSHAGSITNNGGLNPITLSGGTFSRGMTIAGPVRIPSSFESGLQTTFLGSIDGPGSLVARGTISGPVGSTTPLESLRFEGRLGGGRVTTVNGQTYNDLVLAVATTLTSTSGKVIEFGRTLSGPGSLSVVAGQVTFENSVSTPVPLAALSVGAGFRVQLGGPLTTVGGQYYYGGEVILQGAPTLSTTGGGDVTFATKVDGLADLRINTSGTTTFNGDIGTSRPVARLFTTSGPVVFNGSATRIVFEQSYGGRVTLNAGATTFSSDQGRNITFAGPVDGASNLTLKTTGVTTLSGAVGGTAPLASLSIDSGKASVGSVTTTGTQSYLGDVTLNGNYRTLNSLLSVGGATTLAGNTLISTGTGGAAFTGKIDGAVPLRIDSPGGSVVFNANIGSVVPVTSIAVKAATIFAHDTTTTGDQVWDGDVTFNSTETTNGGSFRVTGKMSLGGATTINAGGANVTFSGPVEGPQSLAVNSTGKTTFEKTVGASVPVASLVLTGGGSAYLGGNVVTVGSQTFNGQVTGGAGLQFVSLSGGAIVQILTPAASSSSSTSTFSFPSSSSAFAPQTVTTPDSIVFGGQVPVRFSDLAPQLSTPVTSALSAISIDFLRVPRLQDEPKKAEIQIKVSEQFNIGGR